jgi:hypothetical protein
LAKVTELGMKLEDTYRKIQSGPSPASSVSVNVSQESTQQVDTGDRTVEVVQGQIKALSNVGDTERNAVASLVKRISLGKEGSAEVAEGG